MHPAFYFIRYLMTVGSSTSDDNNWIRSTLQELDLFSLQATDKVLDSVRSELKPPKHYQPNSLRHGPSIRYQQELKVRDMHTMTPSCTAACELRSNAAARELMEPMLLSFTPFPQIARQINKRCRTRYVIDAVSMFCHYFFNVEKVPRDFWPEATRRRTGGRMVKAALVGNPRLVMWRMGESIVVETREALEEAFTQAYMRLQELKGMPTNMATMKMFQMGVDSLVRIFQAMSESEVRMKDVMRQLEQFQQSRREIEIPDATLLGEISAFLKPSDQAKLLPPGPDDLKA